MKNLTFLLLSLIIITTVNAQSISEPKPFIEITGTSELKIVPNQIFISITLQENIDKSKKSINDQEKDLLKALSVSGISADKLVVTDASAYYGKSGILKKDVVNSKQFELEVKSAGQSKKAFEAMDKLNIKNAQIIRVDHTDMDEYKKQAKIKAIKAAKAKAQYLLSAVGEELGGALIIRENSFNVYGNQNRVLGLMNISSYAGYEADNDGSTDHAENFKKITITASIYTKWEIGN